MKIRKFKAVISFTVQAPDFKEFQVKLESYSQNVLVCNLQMGQIPWKPTHHNVIFVGKTTIISYRGSPKKFIKAISPIIELRSRSYVHNTSSFPL